MGLLQTLSSGKKIECPACQGTGYGGVLDERINDANELLSMYDTSPLEGENGLYGSILNDGLTEKEMENSRLYAALNHGVMLVTGRPGSGKDTWAHHLAWRNRRFFKDRKALLDKLPRPLFDLGYESNRYFLFNGEFMTTELDKMAVKSGTVKTEEVVDKETGEIKEIIRNDHRTKREIEADLNEHAKGWITNNEVMLENGVLTLSEFKFYVHNRQPMNKTGIMVGRLVTVHRHLGLFIVGCCPFEHEIDALSVLPYVTHKIITSIDNSQRIIGANYYKVRMYDPKKGITIDGKPIERLRIDGKEPRPEIGVQLIDFDADEYEIGGKEREIVEYLQNIKGVLPELDHISNLNQIQKIIDEDLDELNERLLFMHDMGIVKCKGFFDIFNSKNYSDVKPHLAK